MTGLSRYENWNENNLNPLLRINCSSSMVLTAAEVIAPIAYIKLFAVKNHVVGLLMEEIVPTLRVGNCILSHHPW